MDMQVVRTPAQIEASRSNGARSSGPTTAAGKARAALNGTRHGLCSAQFFLLPDEDPAAWAAFAAGMLATLRPSDDAERHAAERAVQAMWREMRADRLEAVILSELFAAGALADPEAGRAAREAGMRSLSTLLRYRARIQRDIDRALQEKEKEFEMLKKEAEIKTLELNNTRLFITLLVLIVIIVLAVINFYYMGRRRKFLNRTQ